MTWYVAKYGDPYSELVLCIYPSKVHTHSSEHTPGAVGICCGAWGAVVGSVLCSKAPQLWYWGWREHWLFTPPTYNSCQSWDSNLQPLGYESDSLTIRPRLPDKIYLNNALKWHLFLLCISLRDETRETFNKKKRRFKPVLCVDEQFCTWH